MGQRQLERSGARRIKEVAGSSDKEKVTVTGEIGLNNLRIEKAGTEDEEAERLKAA